ncbi:hypothetical protein GS597_07525 [Synechococcales cyanobacterium C]|uniref:Uncharacterized protein n=1 Tax=Petrachloros mirabilis ULC683 TaxID=2781853 RepID=A0A8K1ZYC3_9CYAN|nr:hypothetical protein [Petrachloros mirabilis]NCJ06361.1 hypothetical protein [Petrachloros mirabilis ULC683]
MVHVRPQFRPAPKVWWRGVKARQTPSYRSAQSGGFVLPLTSILGIAMLLVGISLILRSQQTQIMASTQNKVAQSLAAAETGIAHYQALLNQHRAISTYCARDDDQHTQHSAHCQGDTWLSGTIPTLDVCAVKEVSARAFTEYWHSLTIQHGMASDYRLVRYTYEPHSLANASDTTLGIAELVVEGRAYPENETLYIHGDPTQVDTAKVTVTRLAVEIPIRGAQPDAVAAQWEFADLQDDANCSQTPMPVLPTAGLSLPDAKILERLPALTDDLEHPCVNGSADTADAKTVKAFCATLPPKFLPYGVKGNLDLLPQTVGQGAADTIVLYVQGDLALDQPLKVADDSTLVIYMLEGDLTLSPGSIAISAAGALIVYAHGTVNLIGSNLDEQANGLPVQFEATPEMASEVTLEGASEAASTDELVSAITNAGAVDNAQIYVYGDGDITFTNNPDLKLFVFAPKSVMTLDNTQITGTLWVKTLTQNETSTVTPILIDLEKTTVFSKINRILSWARQSAQ